LTCEGLLVDVIWQGTVGSSADQKHRSSAKNLRSTLAHLMLRYHPGVDFSARSKRLRN